LPTDDLRGPSGGESATRLPVWPQHADSSLAEVAAKVAAAAAALGDIDA